MRYTEDSFQDAWLALHEEGGPDSVPNAEAWVRRVARQRHADTCQRSVRRMAAEYESVGLPEPECAADLREIRAERWRVYTLVHPEVRERAKARYLRRKANETPEQRAHRLEQMRSWRERTRHRRPPVVKPAECAECGAPLEHIEGAKPKRFCNLNCKQRDYNRRRREKRRGNVVTC